MDTHAFFSYINTSRIKINRTKIFRWVNFYIVKLLINIYVLGITLIFYQLPFWDNAFIKDIIVWFVFSGLIYCMNAVSKEADEEYIRKVLKDNLILFLHLLFENSSYHFE